MPKGRPPAERSDNHSAPNYSVPALEKGLDVLERLAGQERALTQAQLARALGRGASELFRTLAALERRGYIQRDPISGAYSLTLRTYELGHAHSPYERLLRAAERPMRALTEVVRESCHLSVVNRGRVLALHQEESPARVRLSIEVGNSLPLLRGASGRLLLAFFDDDRREEALRLDTDFPRLGAAEQANLLERLELIRSRGYEEARDETVEGVIDLSVPIGAAGSRVQAALTIAALSRTGAPFDVDEALAALRGSAAEIARSAGLIVSGQGVAVGVTSGGDGRSA
jgi:DNA-binding IclR family transcriptional regulator